MSKGRHSLIAASYLVPLKNGKVCLLRRYNTGYEDGNYSLIAGHLEIGETFTSSIIRETAEEAGIRVAAEDIRVAHVMQRDSGQLDGPRHRIDVFCVAEKWEGEIENLEPEKCDDLSWFDLAELPENTVPYIREALENIQKNIFYSESGFNN